MDLTPQRSSADALDRTGKLEGCWCSRGYGWLLELRRESYSLFDRSTLGVVPIETGTAQEFAAAFDRVAVSGDFLSLYARGEITRYEFDRIDALPEPNLRGATDPQVTFEHFWRIFEQDYAFFELRDADWPAAYRRCRPLITAATDRNALFDVLCGMIAPLADNHVSLKGDGRHFISEKIPAVKALMVRELGLESPSLGRASTIERYQRLVSQRFMRGTSHTAGNRLLTWGWVAPQVGFLNILRFFGYADSDAARALEDLPARRPDAARLLAEDLEAADAIMMRVLGELSAARALVIDVRVNGGGFDRVALHIARWFADRQRLAFSKCARWGATTTELQAVHVELDKAITRFTRPVYLLTGERTASAGEVFTLAMRCLPNVTLVGRPTLGIISDNLRKRLPNGWEVSISNEIYSAPDGSVYERDGIAPDVATVVFDPDDFQGGLEVAIHEAIRLAMAN